ncbi:MAG: nucleoside recognition domain-containing protein, partial [Bacteroidia bacterium]
IGLLEDSGYMVRASFITDRLMRKIGLNGRSVIPLVGGFACAIPAMMATRSIRNRTERLATILVVPLMSCSARLPVYVLLISLAIPAQHFIGPIPAQSFVMTAAYFAGIFVALIMAALFKAIHPSRERSEFILELPAYQKPRLQTVAQQAWLKCRSFLQEAGSVILLISVVLWALSSWGPGDSMKQAEQRAQAVFAAQNASQGTADAEQLEQLTNSYRLEASYAGHLGHAIEPAIAPLGYDWKTGIALISSFAAREVFVGTMSTLFQSSDDNLSGIRARMQQEVDAKTGKPKYGLAYALSLIVFYAFALQCISTMAVMKKETGTWSWPISLFVLYGAIAWVGAYGVYHLSISLFP